MENRKSNWIGVIAILGIVLVTGIAIILSNMPNGNEAKANDYQQSAFVRVKYYYDDSNTFQEVVYDPDTMVMYVIIDGKLITPLYNADGTLKTYKPE